VLRFAVGYTLGYTFALSQWPPPQWFTFV